MLSIMAWTRELIRNVLEYDPAEPQYAYYIGKIDNAREQAIGIYSNVPQARPKAIGDLGSYDLASIRLLLHGSKNARETEIAARDLYAALDNRVGFEFGTDTVGYAHVFYIDPLYAEPTFLGTDENGVYEYHVPIDIYYKEITNNTWEV